MFLEVGEAFTANQSSAKPACHRGGRQSKLSTCQSAAPGIFRPKARKRILRNSEHLSFFDCGNCFFETCSQHVETLTQLRPPAEAPVLGIWPRPSWSDPWPGNASVHQGTKGHPGPITTRFWMAQAMSSTR